MLEPLQDAVHAAGDRRDDPARRSPAARSAAGSSSTSSPTRPSRSPTRSSRAWCSPRSPAFRCCSAATPAIVARGAGDRARRAACPGSSRDVGVAVVVTTMFGLGVLLALSPDSPPGIESLLFGDILGPTDGDLVSAAALVVVVAVGAARCCTGGCWRPASTAPRARGARASRRRSSTRRCWSCSRPRSWSPCRASATCSSSPSSSARPPPPATLTDRIVPMIAARRRDRGARRPRRPLPLLLRRDRRRRLGGAGDRRRLPALAAGGPAARAPRAGSGRAPEATIG